MSAPPDFDRAAERIASLSPSERTEMSSQRMQSALAEYEDFNSAFGVGNCYICSKLIKTFSSKSPCLHWFLRPKGFQAQFPNKSIAIQAIETIMRCLHVMSVHPPAMVDMVLMKLGALQFGASPSLSNLQIASTCGIFGQSAMKVYGCH